MTEDEIVGWYHWLDGHGFGWTLGVGDGQGGLVCCSPRGRKQSDTTEWLNWTEPASVTAAAAAKSLHLCPTLWDPIDGRPPGSLVLRILQARTLEWVAISFSNAWKCKWSHSSCPTVSDPMDCSLPGSSTHGIFQARELEWVAIAFSRLCHQMPVISPQVIITK